MSRSGDDSGSSRVIGTLSGIILCGIYASIFNASKAMQEVYRDWALGEAGALQVLAYTSSPAIIATAILLSAGSVVAIWLLPNDIAKRITFASLTLMLITIIASFLLAYFVIVRPFGLFQISRFITLPL